MSHPLIERLGTQSSVITIKPNKRCEGYEFQIKGHTIQLK